MIAYHPEYTEFSDVLILFRVLRLYNHFGTSELIHFKAMKRYPYIVLKFRDESQPPIYLSIKEIRSPILRFSSFLQTR